MSAHRQLKKQLLHDAVADNVAAADGRRLERPPTASAEAHRRTAAARPAMLALAVTALAAAALAGAAFLRGRRPAGEPAAPRSRPSPEAAAGAERPATTATTATTAATAPSYRAPRPIETSVFPLAVRRVVLDPGHGGDDYGTITGDDPQALHEKAITLDIAERLEQRLLASGFEVSLTRRTDRSMSLRERALLANQQRADLFVSIHVNWIANREVHGVETYFLGPTDDPALNDLARRENRRSGYSLADLRRLLEGIYADVRQDQSRHLAARIQRSLYQALLPSSPALQDRGVKTAPFVVLVATEMPAILAEVSCLSNRAEAERLARVRYREHIAEALFQGIRRYADDVHQTAEKGS